MSFHDRWSAAALRPNHLALCPTVTAIEPQGHVGQLGIYRAALCRRRHPTLAGLLAQGSIHVDTGLSFDELASQRVAAIAPNAAPSAVR
jgi:hypothetical protein